ncbi:hypothetical protein LR48_Vigan11g167600 [Vigna angularis]|uniref:Secreted protein n=1 Tax=Phaseolus angularis TaxID=3914 RepID=A0A0L9VUX1_PHAAN|nr:hypothetical protein LR48_Vigan11g167600 [Vigna angularis]
MKLAMMLRFAWMGFFSGARFRVAALGFIAVGDGGLRERLVAVACTRTELKRIVVVEEEEEEERVVKEGNFQFQKRGIKHGTPLASSLKFYFYCTTLLIFQSFRKNQILKSNLVFIGRRLKVTLALSIFLNIT